MLDHVPLHLSAISRSPALEPWIRGWASEMGHNVELLTPEGWFERGHDIQGSTTNVDGVWMPAYQHGTFIWAPPPGAARQALEELRQTRHKRQVSHHIFVCPRLLWNEWRRHLYKSADVIFEVPPCHDIWDASMHEPLMFALFLPYLDRCPWELRKTGLVVELERNLREVFKKDIRLGRDLLSQFLCQTRELDHLPLRKLRGVLRGRGDSKISSESGIQ